MFSLILLLSIRGDNLVKSQDQPKPKKDTVNMDTNAKPTFYYAEEDGEVKTKGNTGTIILIAGVAVVIFAGAVLLLRRKKK